MSPQTRYIYDVAVPILVLVINIYAVVLYGRNVDRTYPLCAKLQLQHNAGRYVIISTMVVLLLVASNVNPSGKTLASAFEILLAYQGFGNCAVFVANMLSYRKAIFSPSKWEFKSYRVVVPTSASRRE